MTRTLIAWSLLGLSLVTSAAFASTETNTAKIVKATFYPYQTGVPHQQGITPGTTISQRNRLVAEECALQFIVRKASFKGEQQ